MELNKKRPGLARRKKESVFTLNFWSPIYYNALTVPTAFSLQQNTLLMAGPLSLLYKIDWVVESKGDQAKS